MLIGVSTFLSVRKMQQAFLLMAVCLFFSQVAAAQVITIPSANPNDSSTRKPFGCTYGYERSAMLYTSGEVTQFGSITKVGFYLNSKTNPASATPVVIRMKTITANALTSTPYANLMNGSTQVYAGIVTSSMLNANSWVTITLNTAFNYSSNNLVIIVETNYGEFGGEDFVAKQFRHATTLSNRCEYWEDDLTPPADYGILISQRPTVQLTFEPNCAGTPDPGNTLSTSTHVCINESFTLSLQNTPTTPGLSYVWQSSPTGGNPWTTIVGATGSTLTTTQASPLYYRCKVTCDAGGATGTSNAILIDENPYYECYCASYAADISDSKINSFQMADISTSSPNGTCESYTDYTAVPGNVAAGQQVTIKIGNGSCSGNIYDSYVGVYIDYNQNGVYDEATELVYGYGPIINFNAIPDYTFIFPTVAPGGITGMRVILTEGDSVPYACGEYVFGETEDYLLNITPATSCTGAPVPGVTLSSQTSVCPTEPFNLSIANYQNNTGISYQWQSSLNNIDYTNISGATSATKTQVQSAATWYRCNVTCDNSGTSTKSDPVQVTMNPFYACYCASYSNNFEDTKIDSVKIGNLVAGSSPANCEAYTDNTSLNMDVANTGPVTIHIDNGSCSGQFYEAYVAVYIDYNQNKIYDGSELVYSYGPTTDLHAIPDGIFNIPGSALLGKTGMRVILSESESVPPACGTFDFGETEDYAINIVNEPPCINPPTPGTAAASTLSFCSVAVPADVTLSLTGNSSGLGQTYQWQSSPDNSDYTDIPGATSTSAVVTVTATTYYRCKVTCSGNSAYSAEAEVTVKPVPLGNTQSNPIVISSFPYTHLGNNLSTNCWTSDYTNTLPQVSPDIFYAISLVDTSGTLEISTCETTGFNTYLHLIDDQGNHLNSNNNNGPYCSGQAASMEWYQGTVPVNLFIVVEGQGNDEGNYQLDVNFIPDSATAVADLPATQSGSVTVYPNPGNGDMTVQIHLEHDAAAADLNVFNTIGQLVYAEKIALKHGSYAGTLHLNAALPAGIYNLQVNDGNTVMSKPIVIQR